MPLTSHNNVLGWVHLFRFNDNNVLSGKAQFTKPPFPAIIASPSMTQCWKNWNIADTGLLLFSILASTALAYPMANRSAFSIL